VPLRPATSAALTPLLTAAGDEHPWPPELPPSWSSDSKRTPAVFVRVVPEVVVEVRVDVAAIGGRWRHGLRYQRLRTDVEPDAVPRDLEIETG